MATLGKLLVNLMMVVLVAGLFLTGCQAAEPPAAPTPEPTPASAPNTPSRPSGPSSGVVETSYTYSTSATDPDDDQVKYIFDWGDGTSSETGYVISGANARESHSWSSPGTYNVKARVVDRGGGSSGWSSSWAVTIVVKTFTLSTSIIPYGSGNITPISGKYEAGTKVPLTAEPSLGYKFSHWSGDISATSRTITIAMDSNKNVTAHFVEIPPKPVVTYTLKVSIIPARGGMVTLSPEGGTYTSGTKVEVTAMQREGFRFVEWSGDIRGTHPGVTIIMDSDKSVTANFVTIGW